MDKDSILAMPAGRELDELIAEKVFGYKHFAIDNPGSVFAEKIFRVGLGNEFTAENYSTDIAASWEVIDELTENVGIDVSIIFDISREYKVKIKDDGVIKSQIQCKTAPEAIAKAALLATLANNQA